MAWLEAIADIEDLEDAEFDAALVAELERRAAGTISRPIRFSTPTFKEYVNTHLMSYWQEHGFPPQCRALEEGDFECD